jgi:hypothetical protein
MTGEDRRFYGLLLLAFGPLFIAGGWLASFTLVGVALIVAGSAMLLAAPLLLRSIRVFALACGLVVVGWGWPWMVSL